MRKLAFIPSILLIAGLLVLTPITAISHDGDNEAFSQNSDIQQKTTRIKVGIDGQKAIGLQTIKVKTGDFKDYLQATGKVQAADNQGVDIYSPVSGITSKIFVKPGEWVKKGQTLATINSPELAQTISSLLQNKAQLKSQQGQSLLQLKSNVELKRKELELARQNYEREKKLLDEGISAKKDYLEVENNFKKLQIELASYQSQYRQQSSLIQQQLQVSDSTIRSQLLAMGMQPGQIAQSISSSSVNGQIPIISPVSGYITFKDLTLGSTVDPQKQLFSVANLSPIWILVQVFQEQLSTIKTGQTVAINLPTGETIEGKVDNVSAFVESHTKAAEVRVISQNNNGALKPGMSVKAKIYRPSSGKSQVIVLPIDAVIENKGQSLVYVKEGNSFTPVSVKTGSKTSETISIIEGLSADDEVVTVGAKQLFAQSLIGSSGGHNDEHHEHEGGSQSINIDLLLGFGVGILLTLIASVSFWFLFIKKHSRG